MPTEAWVDPPSSSSEQVFEVLAEVLEQALEQVREVLPEVLARPFLGPSTADSGRMDLHLHHLQQLTLRMLLPADPPPPYTRVEPVPV